ncbi:MAG: bifunctional sugar phosphate isomerase/epimerase/4-hydroxyphenylpyruvate dioxygenase family protein [Rhodospirillales bacterium]
MTDKLEAAAAARFDAVEIFENDLLFYDGTPRQARGLATNLGLKIALYQPFRDFEGVSDEQLRRNLDRAERKFDVMQELGAAMMLVCSNAQANAIDDDDRAAAQLHALADRASKRGLAIGYEALAWGARVKTYGHVWRIVQKAAHPHLGVILDSFHTLALGDDPAGILQIPANRIFFVQLADAPRLSMDVLSWSRHFRCFPGQGEFDVAGFLHTALRAGYTGPISLEVFNDDFRASATRPTAMDGMRSLLFLEEQVRQRVDQEKAGSASGGENGAPASRPARRVDLFDPPPVPAFDGVAFLEFAVDSKARDDLAGYIESMGFRRTGLHRSKDVSLFQQGGINLVLNVENDSFAHSYFLMHGPSICAIGLKTQDDMQALSRAEAFICTRYAGRVGPNELHIPAIRALDGGLIYFVGDRKGDPGPLETDFVIEAGGVGAGDIGLRNVDHLALALPAGQMDSWILFYRAVLGLEPSEVLDLADPYGLVRSRAMASRNRKLRLPLNISESRNTATARAAASFAGPGVHHIAFGSADIFASAERLRRNGVPVLAIPANYYDDLTMRLDLAPGLLDRLRQHNVLYDRIGQAEYFQVYTESFDDRFFFEIVERRDGYDLYGAANAPVRMAAQAQRRMGASPHLIELS